LDSANELKSVVEAAHISAQMSESQIAELNNDVSKLNHTLTQRDSEIKELKIQQKDEMSAAAKKESRAKRKIEDLQSKLSLAVASEKNANTELEQAKQRLEGELRVVEDELKQCMTERDHALAGRQAAEAASAEEQEKLGQAKRDIELERAAHEQARCRWSERDADLTEALKVHLFYLEILYNEFQQAEIQVLFQEEKAKNAEMLKAANTKLEQAKQRLEGELRVVENELKQCMTERDHALAGRQAAEAASAEEQEKLGQAKRDIELERAAHEQARCRWSERDADLTEALKVHLFYLEILYNELTRRWRMRRQPVIWFK
jgi:hypothetical protein